MDNRRGDDLEDDFVPDDLVVLSGEEEDGDFPEDGCDILSAEEDEQMKYGSVVVPTGSEKKRKRREKDKERKVKAGHRFFVLSAPIKLRLDAECI
jgi:protein CMS1